MVNKMYFMVVIVIISPGVSHQYSVQLYRDYHGVGPCTSAVFCILPYHPMYSLVSDHAGVPEGLVTLTLTA